jgi:hypothetical protein
MDPNEFMERWNARKRQGHFVRVPRGCLSGLGVEGADGDLELLAEIGVLSKSRPFWRSYAPSSTQAQSGGRQIIVHSDWDALLVESNASGLVLFRRITHSTSRMDDKMVSSSINLYLESCLLWSDWYLDDRPGGFDRLRKMLIEMDPILARQDSEYISYIDSATRWGEGRG